MKQAFNNLLSLLLTIFLSGTFLSAMGQTDSISKKADSIDVKIDSNAVYYYTGSLHNYKRDNFTYIDTTLTYFHQSDPIQHGNQMYASLSNIATASYNMVFSPDTNSSYTLLPPSFKHFLFNNNDIRYYKLINPYSQLYYIMAPSREQDLDVIFSRKIARQLTFGLNVSMISSPGTYYNSFSDDRRAYFTGQYFTKNNRYGVIANYIYNNYRVQENGGLVYDSVFVLHEDTDPKIIPTWLQTAENKVKTNSFFVQQYFNLLKPNHKKSERKIDAGNISYSFEYTKNRWVYSDNSADSNYYTNYPIVFDSVKTLDSLELIRVRNTFQWSNLGYNKDKLSQVFHLYGGVHLDHIIRTLPYDSVRNIQNQVIPFGGISVELFQRSHLSARGQYHVGGYNNGDFLLSGELTQYLGSKGKNVGILKFNLLLQNKMPTWYFSQYQSNRFNWDMNLNKEKFVILSGTYQYKGISVGAKLLTLNNYTYFNDSVVPQQNNATGSILQLFSEGTLMLNKFGINYRAVYQKTTMSNSIHLPEFTGMLDLYFRGWIFNHAGKLQSGVQLYYFTSYYGDTYMPELRSFYLQNKTLIGDYPFVDVYATLKVKTFRIFFKGRNLTGLLGNYHYFVSPHYPSGLPGFSMGVCWRFHN
ncbi:MAG: hypothetical protein JXR65_12440 [Bacteroidales bacterium]|nr:hypothetical protein [Bacteroidales bacterium]